jgi:DnaK suppressor protein
MDDERARELLKAERDRIENELGRLGPQGDENDPVDKFAEADVATDLWQEEFEDGRGEDLREQLDAVARAEQRLADGTYGLSVDSGETIPDERLEAFPTAELTAEEARAKS